MNSYKNDFLSPFIERFGEQLDISRKIKDITPEREEEIENIKATLDNYSAKILEAYQNKNTDEIGKYLLFFSNMLHNECLDSIPGFIENQIPTILYFLITDSTLKALRFGAILCLCNLFGQSPSLYEVLLNEDLYVAIFTQVFAESDLDIICCLLKLMYNMTNYVKPNIINFTLEIAPIDKYKELAKSCNVLEIIIGILDVLRNISSCATLETNTSILELITTLRPFSDDLIKKYVLKIFFNMFKNKTLNFDYFDQEGFYQIIQTSLLVISTDTFIEACRIVSSLLNDYPCQQRFYYNNIKNQVFQDDSLVSQSAAYALEAIVGHDPNVARDLLINNYLFELIAIFETKQIVCKAGIIRIIAWIVKEIPNLQNLNDSFKHIIDFSVDNNYNIMSVLLQVFTLGDTELLSIGIQSLTILLDIAEMINYSSHCREIIFSTNDFIMFMNGEESNEIITNECYCSFFDTYIIPYIEEMSGE